MYAEVEGPKSGMLFIFTPSTGCRIAQLWCALISVGESVYPQSWEANLLNFPGADATRLSGLVG